MTVETVVYYVIFMVLEWVKPSKWFRAPRTWGSGKADADATPISVEEIGKVDEDTTALKEISFKIEIAETLAIIESNGAGRSTLLGILAGCHGSTKGSISFCGLDITEHIRLMHSVVGYCP
jgi:ABC-type polysaccharide/polyol phosphate transport system ATPase subunit